MSLRPALNLSVEWWCWRTFPRIRPPAQSAISAVQVTAEDMLRLWSLSKPRALKVEKLFKQNL